MASNGVRSSQAISMRREISDSEKFFIENLGTLQVYDLFTKLAELSQYLKITCLEKFVAS